MIHQRQIYARSLVGQIRTLLHYREMLFLWTKRELRSRYRQSALGFGWALIQPVFQVVVISIVFGKFIRVPSDGLSYPVFVFAGLLPWILFTGSVSSAIPTMVSNMSLITKIYFPREILPISAILVRVVDFIIGSIVFAGMMIWYHVPVHATLLYIPLLLLIQTFLALGISLLGAAVSVYLRDISFALPLVMQLWMYASPVVYPLSLVPEKWRSIYMWNPMAGIIDSYRRVILAGRPPDMQYLWFAAVLSIGLCLLSYRYFKKLEMTMSDIL